MTLPSSLRPVIAGGATALAEPAAAPAPMGTTRLRAVHRAAADLRQGLPVLLDGPAPFDDRAPLVLLAAETATDAALEEFARLCGAAPVIVLAPARAAALLAAPIDAAGSAVALRLTPALLAPEPLRRLADPTLDQGLPEPPEAAEAPPAAAAAAALALVKLARLLPAVLAAPLAGTLAGSEALAGLLRVSAEDVLAYRGAAAASLRRITEARVPLGGAEDARVVVFRTADDAADHLAIVIGAPEAEDAPLVRLHSECFTGDLLDSLRCDCGPQLRGAIRRMAEAGAGVLLYLAQEGRGIGLASKLRAYALQDRGLDTLDANRALGWEADERSFRIAATMLETLGIRRVRLMTNNPEKLRALAACGIDIAGREPHVFAPNGVNDLYLATKARRFGHLLG